MQKTIVLLAIFLFSLPAFAFAQQLDIDIPFALSNELRVEIIPTYIRPYEKVYINLSLYTADLDSADIAWFVDGKQTQIGHGLKTYSFTAKAPGETTDIDIRIRLNDGTVFNKQLSLTPISVDLLWEAQGYTPPFYKGKTLHAQQGVIKVVAMPEFIRNGERVDPKSLIYQWSNGVEGYVEQSGYGRQTLVINGSLLGKTENIEVVVKDPKSNLETEAFVDIGTVSPQIVFYEYSPYYGHIYNQSLSGNKKMEKDEMQIVAAPYFFSDTNNITYNWTLNGNSAENLKGYRTVLFRKPEDTRGSSLISLNITNPYKILQFADKSLSLSFDQ